MKYSWESDLEYALTFYKNLIEDSAGKGPVEMFEFKAFATEGGRLRVLHLLVKFKGKNNFWW